MAGALAFRIFLFMVPFVYVVFTVLGVAMGADVLHLLTTYWIGHLVARNTHTYGAVGIALAVLLWVYILGRIVVASAGLNAALVYRRQHQQPNHEAVSAPRSP